MRARSLDEKAKVAVEEWPSGGGAVAIAATGSTHNARGTPSQAGLLVLSSQPEKLPCEPHPGLMLCERLYSYRCTQHAIMMQ